MELNEHWILLVNEGEKHFLNDQPIIEMVK